MVVTAVLRNKDHMYDGVEAIGTFSRKSVGMINALSHFALRWWGLAKGEGTGVGKYWRCPCCQRRRFREIRRSKCYVFLYRYRITRALDSMVTLAMSALATGWE